MVSPTAAAVKAARHLASRASILGIGLLGCSHSRFFAATTLCCAGSALAWLQLTRKATGSATTSALPVYRTPGQQAFFNYRDDAFGDGKRLRLTAQFYYSYGSLGLLGEAVESAQRVQRATNGASSRDIRNAAWQLQLLWLITGEQQKFRGPIEPISPLSLDANTWGALEVVARYHELNISTMPSRAASARSPTAPLRRVERARWESASTGTSTSISSGRSTTTARALSAGRPAQIARTSDCFRDGSRSRSDGRSAA